MKTLIFIGSPRKNGNTSALVDVLVESLEGDVKIVRAYDCGVKACIDCRYCWKNPGCAVKDGMQEIYEDIQESDNIVLASPLQFSELAGQLMAVLSRLQTYWCARFLRKEQPVPKKKRGAVILVAGGRGPFAKAEDTARTLLTEMNAPIVGTVTAVDSDEIPSASDETVTARVRQIARMLNAPL